MQFHLVVPGLAWPTAAFGKLPAQPALAALPALLGHASHAWRPPVALETWLAGEFGLSGARLPYALLRRRGEASDAHGDVHWLCCDPAHLHFSRDRLLLADASGLAITRDEADILMAGINETFPDIGRFEAPAPDRWYVALAEEPKPHFYPISDVNGRPVQLFMPEGDEVARWARLSNELEVWLYNHPVNAAREEAGQRTINGVWLWGAGPRDMPLRAPASHVQANQPFARGLARRAGIDVQAADHYHEQAGAALAIVDSLQRPALHMDSAAWLAAVEQLDADWFAPLLAALKAKKIRTLRISAPGDKHFLHIEVSASGMWKFWRKPRTLDTLLASAPAPNPQNP
jgi:hypothetical protein